MTRKIVGIEPVPGGYAVDIEVTGAFTDGSSRFDKVHVPAALVDGRTVEEITQAVADAVNNAPLAQLVGVTLAVPAATKELLVQQIEAAYASWQMWKAINAEVVARNVGGLALQSALANYAEDRWTRLLNILSAWRTAQGGNGGVPKVNQIT